MGEGCEVLKPGYWLDRQHLQMMAGWEAEAGRQTPTSTNQGRALGS